MNLIIKIPKRITVYNFFEWILAILLTIEVNSVFMESYDYNFHIMEITCMCAGLLAVISMSKFSSRFVISLFIYEILAFVFMMISVEANSVIAFICKFMLFVPVMLVIYYNHFDRIVSVLNKLSSFVFFLAAGSLVFYIFGALIPIIPSLGTFTVSWGGCSEREVYWGFLFAGQYQEIFGMHILRNTGIYTEGPMYGFVLTMALAIESFLHKNINRNRVFVLGITILTTMSVASIMVLILIFAVKFYQKKIGNGKVSKRKKTNILILMFPLMILMIIVLKYLFEFKMNTGSSFSLRLDDWIAALEAWKSSPLFGVGYGNMDNIIQYMMPWRQRAETVGYSNALGYIFATCGIYGAFLYLFSILGSVKKSKEIKEKNMSFMFIVLFGLLLTTLVPMHLYVLNYIAIGLSFVSLKKAQFMEVKLILLGVLKKKK